MSWVMELPSLVYRRYRGDMIEVFKYLRGMYSVKSSELLPRAPVTALRGHDFKLMKRHCRSHARLTIFSFRVVTLWNNLPSEVVSAPSLNTFKGRLDKYWGHHCYSLDPSVFIRRTNTQTGHYGLTSKAEEEGFKVSRLFQGLLDFFLIFAQYKSGT